MNRRIRNSIAGMATAGLGMLISAFAPAAQAQSEMLAALPPQNLTVSYELFGGGFRLASVDARVETGPDRYRVTLEGATRGVISLLGDWRANAEAEGRLTPAPRPERFALRIHDASEPSSRRIAFAPGGATQTTLTPPEDLPPVPPSDLVGALDPLSALISASLTASADSCPDRLPVYDGTRRYDITFLRIRRTTIDGSGAGGFTGQAVECRATMIPVSGHWRDPSSSSLWRYSAPGDDPNRLSIRLWFAAPVAGAQAMLVRAERSTAYGHFLIHLTDARIAR